MGPQGLPVWASWNSKLLWCVGFENATLQGSWVFASHAFLFRACVLLHLMAMTSVVCIPKPFPGVSTEDGSWLLLEARLSEYAQGLPSCTRSPSRSETSPAPLPMLALVSPLLQKQPYPGILLPLSSGPDPRTSASASMAEAYQGCDCLAL